jgi:hypothetical protein
MEHSNEWELIKLQREHDSKRDFRQWVLILVLIASLVISNLAWIWYINQFEYAYDEIMIEQDGERNNVVGGGDVNYGAEDNYSQGADNAQE